MNQYTAMVARLPPATAPVESATATSQTSEAAVPVSDLDALLNRPVTTENNPSVVPTGAATAKLEDLGSDDDSLSKFNKEPLPSTSKQFLITPDQQQSVPSTSANSSSSSRSSSNVRPEESSEMSEIRRRRLEKFGSRTSSD